MKKAIITMDYKPDTGGVAEYWSHLFALLPKDQFILIAPKIDVETQDLASVIRTEFFYKTFWPKWLKLFFNLRPIIKDENIYHIVAGQILPIGTVSWLLKKFHYIDSYSVSCHSMDIATLSGFKKWLAKLIFKSAAKVIVNSNYTKSLVKHYGFLGSIDIVYPAPQTLPAVGKNLNYDWLDNPILLSVGRLVKRKGFAKVINILPQVWQKFPEVHYVIIGEGNDREYLENLIYKLPKAKQAQVHLLGRLDADELVSWYSQADVFVLPSSDLSGDVEGFGIVNIEAASQGLPVIVGQDGGVPESVLDNISGFSIDSNNPEILLNKILGLLSDSDKAKKMGQTGAEFAQQFTWDKSVAALIRSLEVL